MSARQFTVGMTTRLQALADQAAVSRRRAIGEELRRLREDAGASKSAVARLAGIDPSYLTLIEQGRREPTGSVLGRVAAALGADVSLRLYPSTGPRIRDRFQARMIEALLQASSPAWQRYVEVPVQRPVRGFVDLLLFSASASRAVAVEAHSDLRRLEQQLRWAAEKSDALPSSAIWTKLQQQALAPLSVSRVLLLRSTARTRELVRTFSATLRAAYPADPLVLRRALTNVNVPWPGDGILWARVDGTETTILDGVPRGLRRSWDDSESELARRNAR